VLSESERASKKIGKAAADVMAQLTADASLYVHVKPSGPLLEDALVSFKCDGHNVFFLDALKTAFIRYLPSPSALKRVVVESDALKLSSYEEDDLTNERRCALNEKIERVRKAAKGLIDALNVDESRPLDGTWLRKLQEDNDLPTDQPILPYPSMDIN